jgi:F420-non-reducing hydrogenase iron-sulfur subunit
MRLGYPASIRIVKLPCSGRVDVIHMMKAMEEGADGIIVAGCIEGDCHYQVGNLRARKRVAFVQEILEKVGIGGDRVAMYNLSAGQGPRFAEIAREMTEKVKALGPSPARKAKKQSRNGSAEEMAA